MAIYIYIQAQVIRDGNTHLIPSEQLVPGDIIILEEGDMVPADVRLIEVSQLEIVESILTGESLPVRKSTDSIISKVKIKNKKDQTKNQIKYFD